MAGKERKYKKCFKYLSETYEDIFFLITFALHSLYALTVFNNLFDAESFSHHTYSFVNKIILRDWGGN